MTTRWPCIVIALFCSLLPVVTSASAECAWVLWARDLGDDKQTGVIDAFKTKEECDASLSARQQITFTYNPEHARVGGSQHSKPSSESSHESGSIWMSAAGE